MSEPVGMIIFVAYGLVPVLYLGAIAGGMYWYTRSGRAREGGRTRGDVLMGFVLGQASMLLFYQLFRIWIDYGETIRNLIW